MCNYYAEGATWWPIQQLIQIWSHGGIKNRFDTSLNFTIFPAVEDGNMNKFYIFEGFA